MEASVKDDGINEAKGRVSAAPAVENSMVEVEVDESWRAQMCHFEARYRGQLPLTRKVFREGGGGPHQPPSLNGTEEVGYAVVRVVGICAPSSSSSTSTAAVLPAVVVDLFLVAAQVEGQQQPYVHVRGRLDGWAVLGQWMNNVSADRAKLFQFICGGLLEGRYHVSYSPAASPAGAEEDVEALKVEKGVEVVKVEEEAPSMSASQWRLVLRLPGVTVFDKPVAVTVAALSDMSSPENAVSAACFSCLAALAARPCGAAAAGSPGASNGGAVGGGETGTGTGAGQGGAPHPGNTKKRTVSGRRKGTQLN